MSTPDCQRVSKLKLPGKASKRDQHPPHREIQLAVGIEIRHRGERSGTRIEQEDNPALDIDKHTRRSATAIVSARNSIAQDALEGPQV